ncbi:MAG: hypothetical protein ACJ77K_13360 [Bacteroidia bacterium]
MNLITQIVDDLVNAGVSLDSPLLKTKVLAKRLKNETLLNWVNNELNGYSREITLPKYRKQKATIMGSMVTNGAHLFQDTTIPILFLKEDERDLLTKFDFDQSVSGLQALNGGNTGGSLKLPLPPEICALITQGLQAHGQEIEIITARKQLNAGVVDQILTCVRSSLLDLMMELEDEEDLKIDIIPNKKINDKITYIMNNINNTGDGNVVNTGSNNTITVKTKITKNDLSSLKRALKEIKIQDGDIEEICEIVSVEKPVSKTQLGQKANSWISRMLEKSLNGTWQIGAGAAATILGEAVMKYYGL